LELATRKGQSEVVKVLLQNKANVNVGTHTDGSTPLHIATRTGDAEVVKLLVENKANVNAGRHTDGATAVG